MCVLPGLNLENIGFHETQGLAASPQPGVNRAVRTSYGNWKQLCWECQEKVKYGLALLPTVVPEYKDISKWKN